MGLMSILPDSWKTGGDQPKVAPQTSASPPPATGLSGATQHAVQATYGTPPPDQILTEKIIGMVTDTVPAIKALLQKAESIKAMESDLGKRLTMLMALEGMTPMQAADAVTALGRALAGVKQKTEGDISAARAAQVDRYRSAPPG